MFITYVTLSGRKRSCIVYGTSVCYKVVHGLIALGRCA
jgi:hypothetical protein